MRYSANTGATAEMAVHLCWENPVSTQSFSDVLLRAFTEHLEPGPATKQIHSVLQIAAAYIEMRDSLSKRRAVSILNSMFKALERFTVACKGSNPRFVSKEEVSAIAEAGGMIMRTAKASPFPYVQQWLTNHKEAWATWQRQIKREMLRLGGTTHSWPEMNYF